MIYKNFKDIKLSSLGLGNMRLPVKEGSQNDIDYEKAFKVIDSSLESGITYFDTAHVYNNGDSERCLGECMKRHDRNSFYLATKYNIDAEPDYEKTFNAQLERLQTDHIDFYLIHCVLDHNADKYVKSGAIEFFKKKKEEGVITYLGFSSHASTATLEKFADLEAWDFAQIQLNYYDWYFGNAKSEYEALHSRNIPIVVMEPVRGGRLSKLCDSAEKLLNEAHPDWSISSWALRFVNSLPGIQVILSGMSTPEQVEDNIKTFSDGYEFTSEDHEILKKAADLFKSYLVVPCTGCRYCTENCPMKINIPEFLKVLNSYKTDGPWALNRLKSIDSEGLPTDCIGCGGCVAHCPQSINIPYRMEELAELMQKQ